MVPIMATLKAPNVSIEGGHQVGLNLLSTNAHRGMLLHFIQVKIIIIKDTYLCILISDELHEWISRRGFNWTRLKGGNLSNQTINPCINSRDCHQDLLELYRRRRGLGQQQSIRCLGDNECKGSSIATLLVATTPLGGCIINLS